ncbi:cytochrome b-c1 complex subunit 8 [Gloeopeniophorella convolvens]|nr:cytochrome b-c1 complex subunit 8 [Gloeopeniophorella convolvens]
MKPTSVAMSDMPGPKNVWWGDYHGGVQRQRGVVTYSVSPFRQNPTAHLFRGYLFNGYRRLAAQLPYWLIPVGIGYSAYAWAKKREAWQNSKEGHIASGGAH